MDSNHSRKAEKYDVNGSADVTDTAKTINLIIARLGIQSSFTSRNLSYRDCTTQDTHVEIVMLSIPFTLAAASRPFLLPVFLQADSYFEWA